jgi:energy-coupling factor transport system substrate-specific component
MSWELTSFLILAAVIVGGFAWYERSRPPAQVVALVAALAALAIAGRIAFAAFPNVKPTTDIVIFAGFALGAAPGFAVGALAALVSNFWFGQGPWTPWQMAGWGLCGILGAVLALGGRNVGRLGLAAVCGFAGILYGALLNFSLMATYGGDLSLERFGVLSARAVPFEIAHVTGNVVFALIAGPAMVRMLVRFRERFEWSRKDRGAGAAAAGDDGSILPGGLASGLRGTLVVLILLALALATLAPAGANASEVSRASSWLSSAQNADGGWGAAPDDDSGAEMTAWVMLGLEAVGRNPLDVARAGRTPVDFLRRSLDELESPGDLARTILALEGADVDPRDFGGADLVSRLLAKRRDDGSYLDWPGSSAFAAIALRAAGAGSAAEPTLSWLRGVQNDDGGWGDVPGSPSTADGTGAAMQALASGSKPVQRGLSYLRQAQRPGGGFPLGGNGSVNTQSTAWAIQGILAAGGDPGSFRRGGASALDYLSARQADDGHYRYSKSSDQTPVWVSGQALVAAAGKSFPLTPLARAPVPAPSSTEESAGLAPGTLTPDSVKPPPAAPPVVPSVPPSGGAGGSSSGSGGVPPDGAAAGKAIPGGIPPESLPPGVGGGASAEPASPELPADEPVATAEPSSEEDSESGPVGAAVLGLLAGGLLFGAGLGGRRLWMRWRYGL